MAKKDQSGNENKEEKNGLKTPKIKNDSNPNSDQSSAKKEVSEIAASPTSSEEAVSQSIQAAENLGQGLSELPSQKATDSEEITNHKPSSEASVPKEASVSVDQSIAEVVSQAENSEATEALKDEKQDSAAEAKNKRSKSLLIFIGAALLALLGFLFWANSSFGSQLGTPAAVGEMKATIPENSNFATDGRFLLTSRTKITLEDLKEGLSFYPETEYTVEKSGQGFLVQLLNHRNIAYNGTVNHESLDGKTKQLHFTVNGPALTVTMESKRIQKSSPISLRFSEQVDSRSFVEHFSMVPETPFHVEYNLDYIEIYPETEWELTASYQIKIDSGYTSKLGKQLPTNQAFAFSIVRSDGSNYYPEIIHHSNENFIVTEDVDFAIAFTGHILEEEVPVTVETYRLGDTENYKYQSEFYLNPEVKLDALEKLSANTFAVQEGDNSFKIKNPGAGSYVVRSIFQDPADSTQAIEVRTGYLVTPYSLYMQSSKNETLAWVHDGTAPSQNHTVMFANDDTRTGVTDENGLTVIPHPEIVDLEESEEEYYYYSNDRSTDLSEVSILDDSGKLVYFDSAKLRKSNGTPREVFYSYLFLDRSIYRPSDTISFWGFARSFRSNEKPLPETIRVSFDQEGLNLFVDVPIDANGTFSGEIKLDSIKSSYYSINSILIYPGDEDSNEVETELTLDYAYITVKDFQKPAYVIESSVDKDLYRIGDNVTVSTSAAFYDGTPLPNFPLEVFYRKADYDSWEQLPNITTDDDGRAEFTFPVTPSSGYYDALGSNNYRVQIASDGEQITHVESFNFLSRDQLIEQKIEKQPDGKNLQLTVNVYDIDLETDKFKQAYKEALEADDYWARYSLFSEENLLKIARGKPSDLDVNIELRWNYTDTESIQHANRQYNPEGYFEFKDNYSLDFEYIPAYDREIIHDWETKEKKVSVATTNGTATIEDLIYLPEGSAIDFSKHLVCRSYIEYTSETSGTNSSYNYYPESANDYDWSYYSEDEKEGIKGLTFDITNKTNGKSLTPTSSYYRNISVDLDSTINFKLLKDGEPVDLDGTILYTIIQGGLYDYKLVNANEFDLTQTMAISPNSQLVAAYFDGYRVHYIKTVDMVVNTESLEIEIEVTADKDSYRPGDTVKLDVKATDVNGNGVAGNLCLSVVDESIFAVQEQYLSVVNDLFDDLWYLDNYVSRYCTTYRSGGANSGLWSGGKGEGDGGEFYDSFRSNFKDTAKFIPLRTDANGNASTEFVLPDNTTSWRITAVEIGDKLLAGSSTTNIISTLPFFVKPVTSSKYIDGDEISMLAQGHGILLDAESDIDYTVTLSGDSFNETLTSKGKAFSSIEFNFGKLPVGSYKLTTKAQFGGYSDTVEIPLHVIKSNLELVVNTPIDIAIDKPLDINAVRYPVTLSFYNEEANPFFQSINSLFGHYCMMASQRLSRFTAKKVLSQTMLEDDIPYYISRGNDSIADMQQGDGGIGEYPDTQSDLTLTVYLTLIDKEQFNQKMLGDYLRSAVNRTSVPETTKPKAFLALAALGQADLAEILPLLNVDEKGNPLDKTKKDLPLNAKAYYIAAIAYLGEDELATKLYNAQLKPQLKGILNQGTVSYWNYKEADMAKERDAAAIWIAASLLDSEDADSISLHLSKSSWRYRTLFETMIYVTNYDREISAKGYSYTLNGETIDVTVGPPGMKSMVLSKTDLENIRFNSIDDGIKTSAYYVGEPSELSIEPSENISVSKTVDKVDDNTYKVSIKLELSADAPTGTYNLSDWIPSNSRLYEAHQQKNYNSKSYSYMRTEDQKVYIDYYHNVGGKRTETITYTIRQTYSAQSMLDTVYVIHGETGENCSSEKAQFAPDNVNIKIPVVHVDSTKSTSPDKKNTD